MAEAGSDRTKSVRFGWGAAGASVDSVVVSVFELVSGVESSERRRFLFDSAIEVLRLNLNFFAKKLAAENYRPARGR